MSGKRLQLFLLFLLIIIPIFLYSYYKFFGFNNKDRGKKERIEKEVSSPKIALIFDDLGESLEQLKMIFSLKIPLTVSIIPNRRFSKSIAYISVRSGYTVLIHLPMEPKNKNFVKKAYPFIEADMYPNKIASITRSYLNSLQIAKGVNNHMGSKITENRDLMRIILAEVKKKNLFFIDSRTSDNSVAYDTAKEMGLQCWYNEGFIDSEKDEESIKKKLYRFIDVARKKGKIVVIAHPSKRTIKILKEELPRIKDKVKFITVEEFFNDKQ